MNCRTFLFKDTPESSSFITMVIFGLRAVRIIMESLILAQNERWRRVLSMQVGRQDAFGHPRAADW